MRTNQRLGTALAAGAVAICLLLGASVAQAATVIVIFAPGTTSAIAIRGLKVGGTEYKVEFVVKSSDDIWGIVPEFDFPSRAEATAANEAVNAALNDFGATRTALQIAYAIGFEKADEDFGSLVTFPFTFSIEPINDSFLPPPHWQVDDNTFAPIPGKSAITSYSPRTYADFAVVPMPAAVWLFGSGMVGVGVIARRRKMTSWPRSTLWPTGWLG